MIINKNEFAAWIKKSYPDARICGEEREISSIAGHSDKAKEGALFVCLKGSVSDGHFYAAAAYERGCRAFLCEKEIKLPGDATLVLVRSIREGLYSLLSDCYGINGDDLSLCAVTGTKGKTTTAYLLTQILNKAGYKAACSTTLGLFDGNATVPTANTTTDLFTLVPWLSDLKSKGVRYAVIEASSAALAGARLYGMQFNIGILTSFSVDHVGRGEHRTVAEYLCAKRSLFSSYGIRKAIYPRDIYRGAFIVSDAEMTVPLPPDEEAVEKTVEQKIGQRFLYKKQWLSLALPGAHNRTNARLALCAATELTGESEERLIPLLSDIKVEGRYEESEKNGVTVVIDYAHNGESFISVLTTAKNRTRGRILAVFGSVGGRGEGRRSALARAASAYADYAVITSDDPGAEDAFHICAQIYSAFSDKTRGCIITDRLAAIRHAYSLCRPGDTLLLLGKGHESVQKTKNGVFPFSERRIVDNLGK